MRINGVSLSNILDGELKRRKPAQGPHGEGVGAAVVDSELSGEVIQREKAVAGVKAFLVLPVAALHFAVVAGCVWADELMADAQLGSGFLKQCRQIPLAVGEAVGELKAIVRLNALYSDAPAGIPLEQLFEEICRGISGLLRVGRQEAQTGEFINGGVLVQTELRVRNAPAGHHLHIYLYSLAGMIHLFIWFRFGSLLLFFGREHAQFSHHTK